MLSRPRNLRLLLAAVLTALPSLAQGQVIWSDDDFLAADYTTSGAGIQDVRFNFNYNNFDVFGDGFLQVTIPSAPHGGGAGVFVSANNNSLLTSALSFASISPTLANVNVGTGTAHPNYVMRVDVFNSTGTGVDDGTGSVTQRGTTTYGVVGLNQTNTTVQMQALNDPGGGLPGQGIRLGITADAGGAEDYVPVVGGALYRDRLGLATVAGRTYDGDDGVDTGLASDTINDYWLDSGMGFVVGNGSTFVTTTPTNDDLNAYRGDSLFFSPDPDNLAAFDETWDGDPTTPVGAARQYWFEELGKTTGPTHFTGGTGLPTAPAFIPPNETEDGGVPYNRWTTHELYWVDGTFTYVIDGVPIQQFKPSSANTPNMANLSSAGSPVLGFWDLFGGSIALDPDGGNFIIFDNLEISVADAGDVPDMMAYLQSHGYLPSTTTPGDFDTDGDVDGYDFLLWQRDTSIGSLADWQANYGTGGLAAVSTPEPSSMILLASLVGMGLAGTRRR